MITLSWNYFLLQEQIAQDRAERSQKFSQEKLEREEKRKEQEKQKLAEEARKAEQIAAERYGNARYFNILHSKSQCAGRRFDPQYF